MLRFSVVIWFGFNTPSLSTTDQKILPAFEIEKLSAFEMWVCRRTEISWAAGQGNERVSTTESARNSPIQCDNAISDG